MAAQKKIYMALCSIVKFVCFHKRLVNEDPALCLHLFGDDPEALLFSMEDGPSYLERKNCS